MSNKFEDNKGCIYLFLVVAIVFLFKYFLSNDGKNCAYVHIYNPKTGTESDLDLQVDIYEGEVTKIYFKNGGWLDESNFKGQTLLDSDNTALFNDDRGRKISVTLQDKNDCE